MDSSSVCEKYWSKDEMKSLGRQMKEKNQQIMQLSERVTQLEDENQRNMQLIERIEQLEDKDQHIRQLSERVKQLENQNQSSRKLEKRIEQLEDKNILPPFKYSLDGVCWHRLTLYHEIQPGDHVKFKDGSMQYAIVEGVPGRQTLSLVQWSLVNQWEIVRRDITLLLRNGLQLERAQYTKGCYDNKTVVERARARVGETDYRKYTNSASAFPEWCKTGRGRGMHSDIEADNRYKMAVLEKRNT